MSARRFCESAVEWLLSVMHVSTSVLASHKFEDEHGRARLNGFVVHASNAGRYAMAGLWTITIGAILAMTSLPGMGAGTRSAIQTTGHGAIALSGGLWAVALVVRRRNRTPALVELRAGGSGPVAQDVIEALRGDAGEDLAWIVVEDGVSPEALAVAQRLKVRCFAGGPGAIRELTAVPQAEREDEALRA